LKLLHDIDGGGFLTLNLVKSSFDAPRDRRWFDDKVYELSMLDNRLSGRKNLSSVSDIISYIWLDMEHYREGKP